MLGHGGSSAGSYLADRTYPIPSHCTVIILFQSASVNNVHDLQSWSSLLYLRVLYRYALVAVALLRSLNYN